MVSKKPLSPTSSKSTFELPTGGNDMKARNILAILVGTALLAWALTSCNLLGISIDQRVADFQNDLNTPDRSNAYQNFDPNMTEYSYLKSGGNFAAEFPIASNYTLNVVSESNTSAVIVQVSSGPGSTVGYTPPNCYLNLSMTKDSSNNWLISTLSGGGTSGGGWTPIYN